MHTKVCWWRHSRDAPRLNKKIKKGKGKVNSEPTLTTLLPGCGFALQPTTLPLKELTVRPQTVSQKKPCSYCGLCPVFYHSNVKVTNTTVLPVLTENILRPTVHSQFLTQALNKHQAPTEEQPMVHGSIPTVVTNASVHRLAGETQESVEIHFHDMLWDFFFLARVSSKNLPAALIITFSSFLTTFNNSWRPSFANRVKGNNYIKEALVLCWSLSSCQVCECRSVILWLGKLRKDHMHYFENRSGNTANFRPPQSWIIPALFIAGAFI